MTPEIRLRRLPLLFLLAALPLAAHGALLGEGRFKNQAEVIDGDGRYVVGVTEHVIRVGTPVELYLGVENLGTETLIIPNPNFLTPLHGWVIAPFGCGPWEADRVCENVFYYPGFFFFFGSPIRIPPGETREFTVIWNARDQFDEELVPAGAYEVHAGFLGGGFHTPSEPLKVPLMISDTVVPTQPTTWGRIKALYAESPAR